MIPVSLSPQHTMAARYQSVKHIYHLLKHDTDRGCDIDFLLFTEVCVQIP